MRWLVLIPAYYFGAILLFALIAAAMRRVRSEVDVDRLAAWAVGGSMAVLFALLTLEVVAVEDFTLLRILALGVLSFLLAWALPLPEKSHGHRRTSDPQVL